jgi:hypothetical protein
MLNKLMHFFTIIFVNMSDTAVSHTQDEGIKGNVPLLILCPGNEGGLRRKRKSISFIEFYL